MKRKKSNDRPSAPVLQCYICQTIDEKIPPFAAYPVCTRCLQLTPLEIFNLVDRDLKKRAVLAFLSNSYLPQFSDKIVELVDKHLPKLSPGSKRR